MSFGQKVKQYRKRSNLTQDELAIKTGIHKNYLSFLEHDGRASQGPTARTLARIADALNLSPEEVFDLLKETNTARP